MKRTLIVIMVLMLAVLTLGCSVGEEGHESGASEETQQTENNKEEIGTTEMTLKINDEEVNVKWEDNGSVRALAELAAEGPVIVNSSQYGGFEQVGAIGTALPSNDSNMRTKPGDIVLYSGSNMVVFYGSNSWSYTMLGHIVNKSEDELTDLLGSGDVTITLTAE